MSAVASHHSRPHSALHIRPISAVLPSWTLTGIHPARPLPQTQHTCSQHDKPHPALHKRPILFALMPCPPAFSIKEHTAFTQLALSPSPGPSFGIAFNTAVFTFGYPILHTCRSLLL